MNERSRTALHRILQSAVKGVGPGMDPASKRALRRQRTCWFIATIVGITAASLMWTQYGCGRMACGQGNMTGNRHGFGDGPRDRRASEPDCSVMAC